MIPTCLAMVCPGQRHCCGPDIRRPERGPMVGHPRSQHFAKGAKEAGVESSLLAAGICAKKRQRMGEISGQIAPGQHAGLTVSSLAFTAKATPTKVMEANACARLRNNGRRPWPRAAQRDTLSGRFLPIPTRSECTAWVQKVRRRGAGQNWLP